MTRVLVPLADGFEEIEAITIIDVLRRAGITVSIASLSDIMIAKGANGIAVVCDTDIKNISAYEINMIVLPGGWGGTHALANDTHIQGLLAEMDRLGKPIGAICAAPFALERAGVLKTHFTCYPSVENEIGHDGYDASQDIVKDKNILTSRGPATAMCFALAIVKELKGEALCNTVKNGLLARCDLEY